MMTTLTHQNFFSVLSTTLKKGWKLSEASIEGKWGWLMASKRFHLQHYLWKLECIPWRRENLSREARRLSDGWRTNIWKKELDWFSKVPNTNVVAERILDGGQGNSSLIPLLASCGILRKWFYFSGPNNFFIYEMSINYISIF